MKNLLILACLFIMTGASAQQITMERGKFYQEGKQISSYETKKLLMANPEAYKLFKKGKNKEALGGALIGVGSALIVGDIIKGLVSDAQYPSGFTYVGAAAIAVSIPVLSGKNKKIREGVELYNKGLSDGTDATDFNMNVISNANGYGIQITF